jgi:hypothetical protein
MSATPITSLTGAILVAAFPATSSAVDEPKIIHVGDAAVSGARLQPYDNAWIYSATLPDGSVRAQGIWTDHFTRYSVQGKSMWRRLQGMTYTNHVMSSVSNVFDPDSCAPVSNEQHHPDESVLKRTFAGAHVASERIDKSGAESRKNAFDLSLPVFDFYGGTYGILLSCFPLEVGYTATFSAIDETKDELKPVTLSVLREEKVRAGLMGMVKTLVVFVETPGEYSQTFWLSKKPPYIIRLQVLWADKHAVATFDMLQ